jgi:SAM-dependent methyltransferase
VSDPAAVRDDYERLHASLDDDALDTVAAIAGCRPAIGRLNYLDDGTLTALVDRMNVADGSRVLDLGCGRGFVGRWLLSRGYNIEYTALDYSQAALDAVRLHLGNARTMNGDVYSLRCGPYDAIFAIESVFAVDTQLAKLLRDALVPGGRLAMSLSSLDESHDDRVRLTARSLREASFGVERVAVAADHGEIVGRLCAALLVEPPADPWVRERMTAEALRTLTALREDTFRSEVILARASA